MATPNPEPRLTLTLPPEQEGGAYANFAGVWRDNDGFIVDFAVITTPPQTAVDEATGQPYTDVKARIVSRVRIPASQAFELMKALNTQLTQWEDEHSPPQDPGSSSGG